LSKDKSFFFLEMKRAFRRMKNEAGLCPMKRAVNSACIICALHIMRAKRVLHVGNANPSCLRSKRFIKNREVIRMKNDKLSVQSMDFSVDIIKLVKELKMKKESIISNQIGRSGTSIGANIREAQYAHGKADFIAKLQIALKEANETGYWLELLRKTEYIDESTFKRLDDMCTGLRAMLVSSIRTAKENIDKK